MKVTSLENTKGWLERRLTETEVRNGLLPHHNSMNPVDVASTCKDITSFVENLKPLFELNVNLDLI